MQNFSSSDIYNRAVDRLKKNPDWSAVVNDSVISAVLKTNAEMNAETARYMEYLLRESKWDQAQNDSSIVAMASMLGYRPRRKRAASGTLYFANLETSIPAGASITGPNNIKFTTYETSVAENGGQRVTVYQGTQKSITISNADIKSTYTASKLDPYIYIPCVIRNCEDANSITTKKFFRVYEVKDGGLMDEWIAVGTNLFNDSDDRYVEVYNDLYNRDLFYFKFNNDIERGKVFDLNHALRIEYLATDGASGNITSINRTFKYENYSGINEEAIVGGFDEETTEEIKISAPRYYLSSYTAGTKQAYEEAIKGIPFEISASIDTTGAKCYPTKVLVWGSTEDLGNGNVKPITNVSFLIAGLEDTLNEAASEEAREAIEKQLNDYLWRLKAPQDELRFILPSYIPFGINVKCRVPSTSSVDVAALKNTIQNTIKEMWVDDNGLDFEKNFYPSEVINNVCNTSKDVRSVDVEFEAVEKINWHNAQRANTLTGRTAFLHYMQIPFSFSSLFLGTSEKKGLADNRFLSTGYAYRIDCFYKNPDTVNAQRYDVSAFIERNASASGTIDAGVYQLTSEGQEETGYAGFGANSTNTIKQFYMKSALTDTEYSTESANGAITSRSENPGCLDTFRIHIDNSLTSSNNRFATGSHLDLAFDSLYEMLARYSIYMSDEDKELFDRVTLPVLKCANGTSSDEQVAGWDAWLALLEKYVDLYICARPIDTTGIYSNADDVESTVLYIDGNDENESGIINVSDRKLNRFVTVTIERI